jgi:antirestriction protein
METATIETRERPRIYVASLSDYNAGTLHGRWIYADDGVEEIHRQVAQMLAESGEDIAEEWAIHDYDGFGSVRLSEYEDLNKVAALGTLIAEHGQLFGKLAAHFGGVDGIEEARRYIKEGYCGAFDRLQDYAHDLVEECYGSEIGELPEFISCHIDYEAIARDLELCGDVFTIEHEHQVHVFHAHI